MKTFKPCCLSILLIFFLAQLPLQLTANTIGASEEGTKPLIEALKELSEKFQVFFTYDVSLVRDIEVADEAMKEAELEIIINDLLTDTGLKYELLDTRYYVIYKDTKKGKGNVKKIRKKMKQIKKLEASGSLRLQPTNPNDPVSRLSTLQTDMKELTADVTITGTVTDEEGNPLIGATVQEVGTTNGTLTNADGGYSIEVADGATLAFSYIGYEPQEIRVTAGTTVIDVTMSESVSALDEVVVVGYGRQQKRDITGAVATLSAQQIQDIPLSNFENAIQGQIAGVQVTETSGEPGAGPDIRVRGIGSISAGNEPLYVIDGFPISKNVSVGVQGDVFRRRVAFRPPTGNPLGTLNPNDIESIQVLKDAAAASIYGSRGANGVILITTKRGKRTGKPTISYDAFVGTQAVANRLDLMDATQLGEYVIDSRNNAYLQDVPGASINHTNAQRNQTALDAGLNPSANWRIPDDFLNPDGTNTDWQDEIFNNAYLQNHNLSVAGGSENISYYLAGGYFNQSGIIDRTGFDRFSLRFNMEADLSDKLRLGLNLNPSYTTSDRLPAGSPYFARPPGVVYSAQIVSPTVAPRNPDGTPNQLNNMSYMFTEDGEGASMLTHSNALAIIEGIDDELSQFRTFGNIFLEYELADGLIFKTFAGIDINNYKRNFFRKNSLLFRNSSVGEPYGQSSSSESVNWLTEQTLSYNKVFNEVHNFNALIGFTAQKENLDVNQIIAENFPDDQVSTVSGGQVTQGTAFQEQWSLVSYLARVNYSFNDRYLLTGTIRADRSSRFGAGNKTGVFPSVSAGWRISNEGFLYGSSVLNDLKLRVSYGLAGNFLIPNYAAIGLLGQSNYVLGGNLTNGIAPVTISNEDLSWEKTKQFNIGLDFGLLSDRIYGSVEYYNSLTSDLLLAVQVPAALGFTNALQNIGEVQNQGIEISLTSRNTVGAFKWKTDFNFATFNNEVKKLGPTGDPILSSGGAGLRHITRIGDPIGSYFGYVVDGVYMNQAELDAALPDADAPNPRPGDLRFKDVNGDGVINAGDRTVTGNYLPDFIWGITNTFSYKGFSLSVLIQGVEGAEVLNLTRRHMFNGEGNANNYVEQTNRWISEANPGNGMIPRADRNTGSHGNNNRPSSYQVEDASYIRLRNATLSYTFPKGSTGNLFSGLRVYITGTNLFTITDYLGYNPEVNNQSELVNVQGEDYGAYPLARTISLGVNAKF
jgi:TonB-linked SusC/RagA family outer membrane protein